MCNHYFVSHWFSIFAISRLWKQCHKGQWRAVGISYILHYFFIILALASLNALAQKALSAQTGQIVQQQKKGVITDSIQIFELFCFRVWTHKPWHHYCFQVYLNCDHIFLHWGKSWKCHLSICQQDFTKPTKPNFMKLHTHTGPVGRRSNPRVTLSHCWRHYHQKR